MNWKTYTEDINIPIHWVDVSYGNDSLPSYISGDDNHESYHIWIDSHDSEERRINAEDTYGITDHLPPRFHVVLCYGHDEILFMSDDFDDVIQWIAEHPKTPDQIERTSLYI
tara:strand:- start:2170 stop:2505 length:336 start_codon:yes stop_codon:yes gene_type:complete